MVTHVGNSVFLMVSHAPSQGEAPAPPPKKKRQQTLSFTYYYTCLMVVCLFVGSPWPALHSTDRGVTDWQFYTIIIIIIIIKSYYGAPQPVLRSASQLRLREGYDSIAIRPLIQQLYWLPIEARITILTISA